MAATPAMLGAPSESILICVYEFRRSGSLLTVGGLHKRQCQVTPGGEPAGLSIDNSYDS